MLSRNSPFSIILSNLFKRYAIFQHFQYVVLFS